MARSADEIAKTLAGDGAARKWVRWVLVAVLVALAAGVWVYWSENGSDSGAVSYVTEPVTRGPMIVTVTATGTVQPTNLVEVSSELSGTIATVEVDFNDVVDVGQVLATLDATKLRAMVATSEASLTGSDARILEAEANLREAAANYDVAKELNRRGATSKQNFIAAEAAYQRAQAALAVAKADRVLAQATLDTQRADLDKAVIRSPIRGVVLDRAVDAGQIVASSLSAPTLFTIAEDLSRMELRVDVDEADIGRVTIGNSATFTVDAYSGRVFPAQITSVRFAPESTEGVVTYKAILSLDNTDLLLRPGMTATATIIVSKIDTALQVPNAALRFVPPQTTEEAQGGGGLLDLVLPSRPNSSGSSSPSTARTVWILRDGEPTEVPVETGDTNGRFTVILSGEVAEGDLVIIDQAEAQ